MNATQYTPAQLDALRKSFINAITSNAPAGVNIKPAVKRDGVINLYIMNAPAELYDFSKYTTCTRCVKVDNEALKANAALSDIWAHLVAVTKEWSAANNGATLSTAAYIGSPSKSFAPVAKDTRAPRQKASAVEGLQVPASLGVRDSEIVRSMWVEVLAVLADYHTKEQEHTRPALDRLAELRHASAVWFTGDNTPRAYDFAGFRVECAPADLPVLFARYCKAFRVRYVAPALIVEAEPSPVVEVAPVVEVSPAPVVENIPAEVKAEPSPVVEAAPVRRRLGAGRLVARLLVAFLSVIIAALRVLVAVVRLAERGRLVDVIRQRVAECVAMIRARVKAGGVAVRGRVVATVEAGQEIARRALGVRLMAKYRAELIRQRVAERVAMIRARVVAGGVAVRGCIVAAVEAGQMIASRAGVRVAHGVNVAAWVLIVAARRAEAAAEYLDNI
mgnify:CR=1 FL=1